MFKETDFGVYSLIVKTSYFIYHVTIDSTGGDCPCISAMIYYYALINFWNSIKDMIMMEANITAFITVITRFILTDYAETEH